jgi:hypothetical protein
VAAELGFRGCRGGGGFLIACHEGGRQGKRGLLADEGGEPQEEGRGGRDWRHEECENEGSHNSPTAHLNRGDNPY